MTKIETANAIVDNIREKTDTIGVMLSFGKDSLVVLDMVCPKFKKVYGIWMFFVPHLSHIQVWIDWAKAKYPNLEIVEVPHWTLSYMLRSGLYCAPNPKVKLITLNDVIKTTRIKYNIHFMFLGMKKADGMNRRLMLNGYAENMYENNGLVYPVAEFTQREILSYMKMHNIPEPVRYTVKKASGGVGLNVECMAWLEEHYPEDLMKIYEYFPLSRRVLFEYHYKERQEKALQTSK